MKLYKLTDRNYETKNRTKWGEGVEHTALGGDGLCNANWIHAYTDPLLAILLNSIHADIKRPALWDAEGDVGTRNSLKVGCTRLRTVRRIPLPGVSTEQRVVVALRCVRVVHNDPDWISWAGKWESGEERSEKTASYMARAAWAARALKPNPAKAAAWAAAWAVVWAAVKEGEDGASWASAEAIAEAVNAKADLDIAAIAHEVCG